MDTELVSGIRLRYSLAARHLMMEITGLYMSLRSAQQNEVHKSLQRRLFFNPDISVFRIRYKIIVRYSEQLLEQSFCSPVFITVHG